MKIPVLEGQQMIGSVSIREEGLYRVISARVGLRPGVQRLWLCSGTQGACLGVLAPEAGFLRLEKRLSRAAWAALPAPLTHAALSAPAPHIDAPAAPPSPPSQTPGESERTLFGQRFVVFRS